MIRALALWLRHAPDRLLHPARRDRLRGQVLDGGPPSSILFLCHGNVCRSPFAAAYLEMLLQARGIADTQVRSGGFIGPDRGSPAEALAAAQRHGVDLSTHVSALVTPADVQASAWVVVMSAAQARRVRREFPHTGSQIIVLGDADPVGISKRTILDPWNGDAVKFEESYERIVRCVNALVGMTAI